MIANEQFINGNGNSEQLGFYPTTTSGVLTGDVHIPSNVTSLSSAPFQANTNITSVTMGNNVQAVSTFQFYECSNLSSIQISNQLSFIPNYFLGQCTSLVNVVIPDGVTQLGQYTFMNCSNLESVILPNSLIKTTGDCFNNCTKIMSITIPQGVTELGTGMFAYCTSLKTVTILPLLTTWNYCNATNSNNAFFKTTSLENVVLPNNWNMSLTISNGTTNFTNVLTHNCLVDIFSKLKDNSQTSTTRTLTVGTTNLARVNDDEKAIATNKNWTLA